MESVYGPSYRCRHETDELLQIDNEELPREQILREPECINLGFPNCLSQRCCLSNDLHTPLAFPNHNRYNLKHLYRL